ncbi:hypothetical protein SAMN05660742_12272 [Propionispira arboris]|uniref:Uncharacterized protein n=1 Tax=Propionispira arboris TaxID=84035 RepID=A0A1H7CK52_9FIRM|nr:hypothetical protein [Propionispira arboris]SEJ89836.1 hypothetical protein SAMN05660742_12272 [Propionispira arboris]
MGLTDFTFRLILVFIPGIIAFVIIDNLTSHRSTQIHHWLIYSLLLGFLSYLPWGILTDITRIVYQTDIPMQFIVNLIDPKTTINFYEIIIASFIAVLWGMLLSKAINSRWLFNLCNWMGISDKFPELDAWANCIAVFKPNWIRVRDLENDLSIQGKLVSVSDANDRDGIVLENVKVYKNSTSELLYSVRVLYIPKKMDTLLIELI